MNKKMQLNILCSIGNNDFMGKRVYGVSLLRTSKALYILLRKLRTQNLPPK